MKHDAHALPAATLEVVVDALLGLFTLNCAAFGPDFVEAILNELAVEFHAEASPLTPLERRTIYPLEGEQYVPKKLF